MLKKGGGGPGPCPNHASPTLVPIRSRAPVTLGRVSSVSGGWGLALRDVVVRPGPNPHFPLPLQPVPCHRRSAPMQAWLNSLYRLRACVLRLLRSGSPCLVLSPGLIRPPLTSTARTPQASSAAQQGSAPPSARCRAGPLTPPNHSGSTLRCLGRPRRGSLGRYAIFSGPGGRALTDASDHAAILATPPTKHL
ncbi:hypothetical protein NDU88_007768 [Pleurodeles waltl]|uniref:Uncharacterized protein n=1 Tax=Pleurodeles waltl TaxID=8319 RepID=A0AAV7QN08_PLEWA|nr:hypothetical protein NDU88_007768 [Pleurodeles waltl]